jgi:membrane-bound lytic murein transglycosylase F
MTPVDAQAVTSAPVPSRYSSACRPGGTMARRLLPVLCCLSLAACEKPPLIEQIKAHHELIVLTRNSPTTYYEGTDGPMGFEYDLASRFAEYLGVELRIVVPPNLNDILPLIQRGDAHLAAGLTITDNREEIVRFGPVYQKITPQLVYRSGTPRPKSLADVKGRIDVVAGSSHVERLAGLKEKYPNLSWQEHADADSEELLYLVWQQLYDYTITNSNELIINRRYYPELHPAFAVSKPKSLAWAFARSDDDSLYDAAVAFFARIKKDGTLDQLIDRYYGHIGEFDYVGTRRYQAHIDQRLPAYRDWFQEAAARFHMDWRLLAAIGYQESHWNPDAVSPAGVRGLMMLTQDAASEVEIDDPADPEQSILGGTEYLQRMLRSIPDDVPEPDRTWLGLAAYNVGLGHLEDARKLTQQTGGNPNKWVDVKKNLPLLSKEKWFKKTRYGYARGREPVRYVENVRSYYDILVWYTDRETAKTETPKPLLLDTPAL